MILYLDTSTLVKLYVDEEGSAMVERVVEQATAVLTSILTYVETRAALARRMREGVLTPSVHRRLVKDFDHDWDHYIRLEATELLTRRAAKLTESDRLRAYDAVHLASALSVEEHFDQRPLFLSWDTYLNAAANRRGLITKPQEK